MICSKVTTAANRRAREEDDEPALPPTKHSKKNKDDPMREMLTVQKEIRDHLGQLVGQFGELVGVLKRLEQKI